MNRVNINWVKREYMNGCEWSNGYDYSNWCEEVKQQQISPLLLRRRYRRNTNVTIKESIFILIFWTLFFAAPCSSCWSMLLS